jgi:A/G-specific adenine glycosylase
MMDARAEAKTLAADEGAARAAAPDPAALLAWYDRHGRVLPWRAGRGEKADPYRVWLSEIMLQQTRVETVGPYYAKFLARFPTVRALGKASLGDVLKLWAGLGYYARARNLHACARAVAKKHGGRFPDTEEGLRTLPGIGAYTAAAVAAIAFGRKTTPLDGNIERVVARLSAVETPLPAAKPELRRLAGRLTPTLRAGDFAQAMMDLGATICTPRRPSCLVCPWNADCAAFARGDQETFPRRAPKVEGKLRRGAAFVVRRVDGAVLLRTRPARGLLGGMREVPGSEWNAEFEMKNALRTAPDLAAKWHRLPGLVRHVFTHFPLELVVYAADVPRNTRAPRGMRFVAAGNLKSEALPSLMRKVIAHAGVEVGKVD